MQSVKTVSKLTASILKASLRHNHDYSNDYISQKSNLHYTRGSSTPKSVTSDGTHLRGLAPGQHSSEETSWR